MPENPCQELFRRIDFLTDDYIRFWTDIVNLESPTDDKAAVDRVGKYIADKAKARGWMVETFPQPVSGDCVCITMNPNAKGRPIAFSGHIDTVHPVGSFGTPAARIEGDTMYGPGCNDCKGGVAAAFFAMAALDDVGFRSRPVMLLLQTDEETGSFGSGKATIRYIGEKAKDAEAFLNCEGHRPGKTVLRRKGILRYHFKVKGVAGHAARCYASGASAIREAAYKVIELEKMKDEHGVTCSCGMICGGTAENSIPDLCTFTVDVRFFDRAQMEQAETALRAIAETAHVEGTTCELVFKSRRVAMEQSDKNDALLASVNAVYRECGLPELSPCLSEGGSDAADITTYGIPCLDSLGTVGDCIHSLKEHSRVSSLAESAKRLAAVAYCL